MPRDSWIPPGVLLWGGSKQTRMLCALAETVNVLTSLDSYALQWLFAVPLEVMAAAVTLDYWTLPIPGPASITIFLVAILVINLCGVKAFGEAEYAFSILKVVAVIGFMYVCRHRLLLDMISWT